MILKGLELVVVRLRGGGLRGDLERSACNLRVYRRFQMEFVIGIQGTK